MLFIDICVSESKLKNRVGTLSKQFVSRAVCGVFAFSESGMPVAQIAGVFYKLLHWKDSICCGVQTVINRFHIL